MNTRENPLFNPELRDFQESELELVIVCQKIRDEIRRLESDRTLNVFTYSTEARINILNRLLQLLTIPHAFSDADQKKYNRNSLWLLVQSVLNDKTQFKNNYTGNHVTNLSIFHSPSSIFSTVNNENETMDSANIKDPFLKDLLDKHGKMALRKPKINTQHADTIESGTAELEDKIEIDELVIFSDSLSDINLMRSSWTGDLCGLKGNSPLGSFTNGLTWLGQVHNNLLNTATLESIKAYLKKLYPDEDFASEYIQQVYIDNAVEIDKQVKCHLTTENNRNIFSIDGKVVSHSYAIGGATAYKYIGMPSKSIVRYFTRLIVSTLAKERQLFLEDEEKAKVTPAAKKKKLIIDWIGANDLITVNERPSMLEADNIIEARMQNIKELIEQGYTHFVLGNLPDLSFTPRYQALSEDEQRNARLCTEYHNRKLEACVAELREMHKSNPQFNIQVIDVNSKYKACIEGIRASGKAAEPYKSYINKEYNVIISKNLPHHEPINKNDFYVQFDDNDNVSYIVLDACAYKRDDKIDFNTLLNHYVDKTKNLTKNNFDINRLKDEINQFKEIGSGNDKQKMEEMKKGILWQCILDITNKRGHTLDEKNVYIPLKDTIAFKDFQERLAKENPPNTIEDIRYLPGDNVFFFDDVHPSTDIHRFICDEIMKSIGNQYQISTPKVTLDNLNLPNKDEASIATKKAASKQPADITSWSDKQMTAHFLQHYFAQFNNERKGFFEMSGLRNMGFKDILKWNIFGGFRQRNLQWENKNISLDDILQHALHPTKGTGARTLDILVNDLRWITSDGTLTSEGAKNKALANAFLGIKDQHHSRCSSGLV